MNAWRIWLPALRNPLMLLDVTHADGVSPGGVLRAWREHAGLSIRQLATAIGRQPSAVSMWETDKRAPSMDGGRDRRRQSSAEIAREVAVALGLTNDEQAALVHMWRAAGTPRALPPRIGWSHNYQPEGGPVWVWLRCSPSEAPVEVTLGWGPFGRTISMHPDAGGMVVHAPSSITNPPLEITFSAPGWADFGHGCIPDGVVERLAMHSIDGRDDFRGRFTDPPSLDPHEQRRANLELAAMRTAAHHFRVAWTRIKPHLGAMRPNATAWPLDGAAVLATGWSADMRTDSRGDLVSQILHRPYQVEAIRTGMRMSRQDVVEEVNRLKPGDDVTGRQVETLETTGALPSAAWVIARLDTTYRLDGSLGIDRLFGSATAPIGRDGVCTVRFPEFWNGPIWLQLHAPHPQTSPPAQATLDLRWGHWRRLQQIQSGTIVTTRKAQAKGGPPLEVTVPPGWRLAAGMGAVPGAIDINHDWYPASYGHAFRLVLDGWRTLNKGGAMLASLSWAFSALED